MSLELTVSWSEIEAIRQCDKKHQLSYIERWSEGTEGPALRRGNVWHKVLEHWYSADRTNPESALEATDRIDKLLTGDPEEELFRWMFIGYLRRWRQEDAGWRVQGVEVQDVVPMPRPPGVTPLVDWLGREIATYLKLKVDVLVETPGVNGSRRLWVVDHKSGGSLPGDKAMEFEDQFGLYIWVMRQIGRPVYGAIHNGALAKMNKTEREKPKALEDRFVRIPTVRTDRELDEIARDAYLSIKQGWQEYLLEGSSYRAGRTPNGDTCRYRCPFTETCLTGRQQGWEVEQQVMIGRGHVKGTYTNLVEVEDA